MGGNLAARRHSALTRTLYLPHDAYHIPAVILEIETTDEDLVSAVVGHEGWIAEVADADSAVELLDGPTPWLAVYFKGADRDEALEAWAKRYGTLAPYLLDDTDGARVPLLGSPPEAFRSLAETLNDPSLRGIALVVSTGAITQPAVSVTSLVLMFVGYTVHVRVVDPILQTVGEVVQERIRGWGGESPTH